MSALQHRDCSEIRLALTVFASRQHPELPDDIALHLEHCPHCMEHFNALFPPACFSSTPSEAQAPHHPPARQPRRQRSAVAVAAVALLALGMNAPQPEPEPLALAMYEESPLTIEEMLAGEPECPLIPGENDPPVCSEDGLDWM